MRGTHRLSKKKPVPALPLEGGSTTVTPPHRQTRVTADRNSSGEQHDLFSLPLPLPHDAKAVPKLTLRTHILPEEAPLASIDFRRLPASPRTGGYLYLVTDAVTEATLRKTGLPIDKRHPLTFVEPAALLSLIETWAEQTHAQDDTLPVVLRIRKTLIETWLEAEPDESARLGGFCYLLTGNQEPS